MNMEYKLLKELGKGNFGTVWQAEKDGKIIALKIIRFGDRRVQEIALREAKLLKKISTPFCHRSLACFYGYDIMRGNMYLEMEFIPGTTLTSFSKTYRTSGQLLRLNKLLIAIIYDICGGLEYMHKKNIIHRDVKPDNIMIDPSFQPKLIDIGLACTTIRKEYANDNNTEYNFPNSQSPQGDVEIEIKKEEKCNVDGKIISCCKGFAGTPLYIAPESLLDNVSYFSSDVFSLGASIYTSATGRSLFLLKSQTLDELKRAMEYDNYPKLQTDNITLNTLVNNMILKDPLERMDTRQIMNSINS